MIQCLNKLTDIDESSDGGGSPSKSGRPKTLISKMIDELIKVNQDIGETMELNDETTTERDNLKAQFDENELDMETTIMGYREVLENIEKSTGDSMLKKEMMRLVKENDGF